MPQPIHIDLCRDLPKVREQLEAILPNMGKCRYASPCVIGAMMPPERRARFDRAGNNIGILVRTGSIKAPKDQWDDLISLQQAFDWGKVNSHFLETLARLEAKYLTGEVG